MHLVHYSSSFFASFLILLLHQAMGKVIRPAQYQIYSFFTNLQQQLKAQIEFQSSKNISLDFIQVKYFLLIVKTKRYKPRHLQICSFITFLKDG